MNPGRWLWTTAGFVLLAIGLVGYFVPVMPGTVFLILALFCFQNGSMKMHSWMLRNRFFGPTLRDWDENKWISKRVKVIAISFMWIFGVGSCASKATPLVIGSVIVLCGFGTWYVASRPTKPRIMPRAAEAEKTTSRVSGR